MKATKKKNHNTKKYKPTIYACKVRTSRVRACSADDGKKGQLVTAGGDEIQEWFLGGEKEKEVR